MSDLRDAVLLVLALHDNPDSQVPGYPLKLDPMAEAQLRAAVAGIYEHPAIAPCAPCVCGCDNHSHAENGECYYATGRAPSSAKVCTCTGYHPAD